VTHPRTRALGALLMLACAALQPAVGSAVLASALTLALHGSDHAHSLALVVDEGHLDLVLAHDGGGDHPHDHDGAPHSGAPHASPVDDDHVFHVAVDEAAGASSRKLSADPAPLLAAPVARPAPRAALSFYRAPEEPRARGAERIRTVVLRL
jgi:hypothetical protein